MRRHAPVLSWMMLTLLSCVVWRAPAFAQTPDREEAREEAAFELMAQGFEAFQAEDYARAIGLWKRSHLSYPTGLAQLNIARAYLRLQKPDEAQAALRAARGEGGEALRVALDPEQLEQVEVMERETLPALREELGQQEEARVRREREEELLRQAELEEARQRQGTRLGQLGYTASAPLLLGSAGLVASGVFAARSRGQLDGLTPPHQQSESDYEAQRATFLETQRRGRLALYTGGALFALGAGLLTWDLLTVEYPADDEGGAAASGTLREVSAPRKLRVGLGPGALEVGVMW